MKALGWVECEVMYTDEVSESRKKIMELVANWDRKEMTWQENVCAVATIHYSEAAEHALMGSEWSLKTTGAMLGVSFGNVQYSIKLAACIRANDVEIIACSGPVEALRILMRRKEDEAMAELMRRAQTEAATPALSEYNPETFLPGENKEDGAETSPLDLNATSGLTLNIVNPVQKVIPISKFVLHQSDLTMSALYNLGPGVADHCICDPPYGIDLDNINQMDDRLSSVEKMKESHTVEGNMNLFKEMFPTVFRATRDKAFFFLWCDIMQWQYLYDLAVATGWRVQRWPIVWYKTHTCSNQMSQYNTTKNFEIAMVCRKPNAMLLKPVSDSIIQASNLPAKAKFGDHPFVKPTECWSLPIEHLTMVGDIILDPFAGRGSSTITAIESYRKVLAIEQDATEFTYLFENVKTALTRRHYTSTIKFV